MEELEHLPIPKYGEHMEMCEFVECVRRGVFSDYDGFAKYANRTEMFNRTICLRSIRSVLGPDKRFTHVVWFNK